MGFLSSLWPSKAVADACDACTTSFQNVWLAYHNRPAIPEPQELPQPGPLPTAVPAAARLVAIGDIHGDYGKALRAFKLAGLVDDSARWAGGKTVAVQVGDILDRGDNEIRILIFLERLAREAEAAGGKLYLLNGNHETMNVGGDHRYATSGANREIMGYQTWQDFNALMKRHSGCSAEPHPVAERLAAAASTSSYVAKLHPYNWLRAHAFRPGSELTRRFFATRPIILQVGGIVFVHGGVLPAHVEYGLDRINRETQAWMMSDDPDGRYTPNFLCGATAIVWARNFSAEDEGRCDCSMLQGVLQSIPNATRMVVGHTIQRAGINSACEQQVIRVDVGMSRGCGNRGVEVLEVLHNAAVRRLREGAAPIEMVSADQGSDKAKAEAMRRFLRLLAHAPEAA